jgi:hypothetical protein
MPSAICIGNMIQGAVSGTASAPAPPPASGFKFTVDTRITGAGSSNADQYTLGLKSTGTYGFDVDWGDASTDTITVYNQPEVTHTYSVGAIYTIEITGICNCYGYGGAGDVMKMLEVINWGGTNLEIGGTCMSFGYYRGAFTVSATDSPVISGALQGVFYSQSGIVSGLGGWNTTFGGSYQFFLLNATNWNEDISGWNVSNVSSFSSAFSGTSLSTANYDALLIAWSTQSVQSSVAASFGSTQYTLGGAAEAGRNTLVTTYGWSITDGGGI